jgi:hypothetical protein
MCEVREARPFIVHVNAGYDQSGIQESSGLMRLEA